MSKERAHRLFSRLALDLTRVTPDHPDHILCPLCLRPFARKAIDMADPELTEEHIIPEEIGGRLLTLTCRSCNNTHGSQLDAHLIQMLRSKDALDGFGTRPFCGRIEVGGVTVPTDIDWKVSSGETTTFRLRQFNPDVHAAIQRQMSESPVESINVTLNLGYVPLRSYIAVLRIAYLAMFKEMGYWYILSPAASVVREIVYDFEKAPRELGQIVGEARNISPLPR